VKKRLVLKTMVASLALAGMAGWAQAANVSDSMLGADAGESWLHTNGNYAAHRYSTLTQINSGNAKKVKVAWILSPGGKTDAQATPSAHDGVVYFPQDNKVFAIDGVTGKIIWKYEHKLPDDFGGYNVPFFTGKHRGLALSGDSVYFMSNDAKLHRIDMKTGAGKWVKSYDGFPYPKDFAKSKDANGFITTIGPMAIDGGKIIVPMNATDTGGLEGYVLTVKAEDGSLISKVNMIPHQGEVGYDTWPPQAIEFGGAGPWITGSYDPDSKMYFTGTANAYEWNPKNRGGGKMDNVGAASIVAVDTANGKAAWRWVGVPGDPWDFDIPQTPMLINIDGKKTLVQPNKTGYIHHIDPKTGQFIAAHKFVDNVTWIKGYGKDGRPVGQVALPAEGGEPVEIAPGLLGGVNMYPNAYNPKTGNLYLAAAESSMKYGFEEIKVISNVRHFGAFQEFTFGNETDKAVNVKTGQEVWRNEIAKPGYAGGMMTTAGNITAYATQGGTFTLANATTGEILYSLNLGTAAKAGPITYSVNGKQYIVQALGGTPGFGRDEPWKAEFGSIVVAFTLE
jgi:alcohol dehydrogenase (cytochrome c)